MKQTLNKFLITLLIIHLPLICFAQDTGDNTMGAMLKQLNTLIDEAEKSRSADRYFIRDLRDLVNQFDQPWQKSILNETFADGDFTRSPQWKVVEGKFEIRRGFGLINRVQFANTEKESGTNNEPSDPGAEFAKALFGQILKRADRSSSPEPETTTSNTNSAIELQQAVSNSFSIQIDIERLSDQGAFSLSVFQGNRNSAGYRLEFHPEEEYAIDLVRYTSRGNAIIESVRKLPEDVRAGMILKWNRYKDGRMQILLADNVLIDTNDRGFRDPFDGILYQISKGEFGLHALSVVVP